MNVDELTCQELVELVTDYLEDMLTPEERARFEEHVQACEGCTIYVEQMRRTIALTGQLTEDDLSEEAKQELLAVFRNWRKSKKE